MLKIDTTCPRCEGTGTQPGRQLMPLTADRASWDPEALPERVVIDTNAERDVEPITCWHCKGLKGPDGQTYARYRDRYTSYGEPYKSLSTLKAGLTTGKAKVCTSCRGLGDMLFLPTLDQCYGCKGAGMKPTWDPDVDPILPLEVERCDDATPAFMEAWLKSATVVVVREDRPGTWGEMHLGIGGLWSCTDYGRAWDANDGDALAAEIMAKLVQDPPQFIKMIDRESRRFGTMLAIRLHRNGYTPVIADVEQTMPVLPPTYYPVLNKPV